MSILKNCCDFRQRAAVLVDNIFAQKGKKGSTQENIEKLIYYSTSAPEKLNRISARLNYHLSTYCKSGRNDLVNLVFDVVNQLLDQSSSSFKSLIMDDYFKMLLKLLNSNVSEYQILASKSFRKFANINIEVGIFYDHLPQLVSRFTNLCLTNNPDMEVQTGVRLSGLSGIQGLILKTKNSTTQNIWNTEHANLIIPALFENLRVPEDGSYPLDDNTVSYFNEYVFAKGHRGLQSDICQKVMASLTNPFSSTITYVALSNIREILQHSTITNASNIITPIYKFWSENHMWDQQNCSFRLIELITQSLKPQLEHIPIKLLFELIKHQKFDSHVLSLIQCLPSFGSGHSGASLGNIYFEILSLLASSIKESCHDQNLADQYVDCLMTTSEILVEKMPYFQKSQTYQMLILQIPIVREQVKIFESQRSDAITLDERETLEFISIFSCFEKVSLLYDPIKIQGVFNLVFLEQLSEYIRVENLKVKQQTVKILINLVDQHKNVQKIDHYLKNGLMSTFVIPDNDPGDISVKKILNISEILLKYVFTPESLELAREYATLICLFAMEVNLPELYKSLCLLIAHQRVDSPPQAMYLYNSALYLIVNFIASVSKNQKLLSLCSRIKSERECVGPLFMTALHDEMSFSVPNNLEESLFISFDDIRNAFDKPENEIEDFPANRLSLKVSPDVEVMSLESLGSDFKDSLNSTYIIKPTYGSFGFIHRDASEENDLSVQDIKEKYILSPKPTAKNPTFDEISTDLEYYT